MATKRYRKSLIAGAVVLIALAVWLISLPGSLWQRGEFVVTLVRCFGLGSGCNFLVEGVYVLHDVPKDQWDLYRATLPQIEGVEMPAKPQLRIGGMQVLNDFYLEGVVMMRIEYNSAAYWWALVQPLNNKWGWESGLPIGYPKTLEDMCRAYDGKTFVYSFGPCDQPSLTLTHVAAPDVLPPAEDPTIKGQLTLAEDGCLKLSASSPPVIDAESFARPGRVILANNYRAQWAALLPDGEYQGTHARAAVRMSASGFGGIVLKCGVTRQAG